MNLLPRLKNVRSIRTALLSACAGVLALSCGVPAYAHDVPGAAGVHAVDPTVAGTKVATEMADGALAWWNSLSPEQQKQASFGFDDAERTNWHFIPRPRKGLPIKEMSPEQRNLAWAFLSTGLSSQGMIKAQQIMSLEAYLKSIEPGPPKTPARDSEMYFFSVFGTPDAKGSWAWRFEGHHMSINFTIAGGKAVTALPTFMGDNPAEIRQGPRKGLRVMAAEEDLGRKLVKTLSEAQQKKGILSAEAPKDIITMADRKADMAKVLAGKDGLPASEMTPEQRELLLSLIEVYARRHRNELADQELRKIHVAGFDKVNFAWAGGTEPGAGHYYRIHGPTFLVEYDNTQNNANHKHTVWRDPANDFGDDILKRHYETDPHHQAPKK